MNSFFFICFLVWKKNWWLQIGKTDKTDSGLYFHALLVNKPIWRGKHKIIFLQACFVTQIVLLKIFELKKGLNFSESTKIMNEKFHQN